MTYKITVRGARPAMRFQDYLCSCGHRWEETIHGSDPIADRVSCPSCPGGFGESAISAAHLGTVYGYAARKGPDDAPPPGAMCTKDLADGKVTLEEFKAQRREQHRKAAVAELHQKTGTTGTPYSHS